MSMFEGVREVSTWCARVGLHPAKGQPALAREGIPMERGPGGRWYISAPTFERLLEAAQELRHHVETYRLKWNAASGRPAIPGSAGPQYSREEIARESSTQQNEFAEICARHGISVAFGRGISHV